jgi:hypothetical protein
VGTLVCLDYASLISSVGKMKIDSAASERACCLARWIEFRFLTSAVCFAESGP